MEVTVVAQWLAVPSVASWTPNPFRHRHRHTGRGRRVRISVMAIEVIEAVPAK
jgi:hypothetical protein